MSNTHPSPNGSNGRDRSGRFAKGNAGGPGNPHAQQVAQLRAALLEAVTVEDMKDIIAALVKQAKQGDVQAIKELLNRTLGKPIEPDLMERIERLERLLEDRSI